jgi:putative hemolysin
VEHRPGRKAAEVVDFPALAGGVTDRRAALAALPPLLRTYLGMGGWVSDHAVVDRELDTLHVFTCVEVDRIPAARAASLRAVAG